MMIHSFFRPLAAVLLVCMSLVSSGLSAANWEYPALSFTNASVQLQAELHADHPYVALPLPGVAELRKASARKAAAESYMAAAMVSPEPNQLRVQDLRGVECYPQPDNLEVCGAPDTTCFLFFTKSEERLPEIELTLRFGEGLEAAPFADGEYARIDYSGDAVFFPPLTDIDPISVQNPEAPSFLISGVTRDSGSVYICFGIQAECGADFEDNPPTIDLEWRYTTASGVFCEGSYSPPNDFGGDVIVPRVQFTAPAPGDVNLGDLNTLACQTVNITQTTPGGTAGSYIFTASNYGFASGVMVGEVRRNGTVLVEGTDYEISTEPGDTLPNGAPAGTLTYTYDGADGGLMFNDVDNIEICYTYSACIPDVDFTPNYTVVSACQGEICTGPVDMTSGGSLLSNFLFFPNFVAAYETVPVGPNGDGTPDICAPAPYVFDIVINSTIDEPIRGDLNSLNLRVRACASSFFALSMVEVINEDGTSAGAVDEAITRTSTVDAVDGQGNPTLDVAGTVFVDLRRNETVQGDGLVDNDGDGFIDDLVGGETLRLRFTFDVTCDMDDLGSIAAPSGGGAPECQFTQVFLNAQRRCNTQGVSANRALNNTPPFLTESTSEFTNEDPMGITLPNPDEPGYQFGQIGNNQPGVQGPPLTGAACTTLPASTESFVFEYTLGDSDFAACPGGGGTTTLSLFINGDDRLTKDIEFSNIGFDSNNDGTADVFPTPADTTRTDVGEGELQFDIELGDATAGQTFSFQFDITMDTAFCSPRQIINMNAILTTVCDGACNCEPVRTATSTRLEVDPQDCDCICFMASRTEAERTSIGFTDETRTTRIDPANISLADSRRVLPGDTVEFISKFAVNADANQSFVDQLNAVNRLMIFELDLAVNIGVNNADWTRADDFRAVVDYGASRLTNIQLDRPNDGSMINVGAGFSGTTQNLDATGILVGGVTGSDAANDFPLDGEFTHPAFPNGGYTWSSGDDTRNDERDGSRLAFYLRDFSQVNGEFNSLDRFRDIIGGGFQAGDTLEMTWSVVLLENPGFVGPEIDLQFVSTFSANSFIGDPSNNVVSGLTPTICESLPVELEYFNPEVVLDPRIEFNGTCDAEIVFVYSNTEPDPAWYNNEYRPVNGLERVDVEIPAPYYYAGGATFENIATPATAINVDSTMGVDSALVGGNFAFRPEEGSLTGTITFLDAEFQDSVRMRGYANIDFGDDDITTVGGTFPLIGVGANRNDSLVIRIPVRRLCGDEPTTTLDAFYTWANRHLGDYEQLPYRQAFNGPNRYWDGKVVQNDGSPAVPVPQFQPVNNNRLYYFPFPRLQVDAGDAVNPHRDLTNGANYTVVGDVPPALTATSSATPAGMLTDAPGDEVKTVTITPGAGTEFSGTVLITVGTGATLSSVTVGGAMQTVTQAAVTDSLTVFAFAVPPGNGVDAPFVFDLATDLAFCESAEICITPLPGCSDDIAGIAEAANAFGVDCGGQTCYSYLGGQPSVMTTISDPQEVALCTDQTYTVQYFNDGTSDIANFSPVLFFPEGLDVSNFMATTTGNPTPVALADPTPDPSLDEVFGTASTFAQADIDAAVAGNGMTGFNPGQVLTITFTGATSCDFTSGTPLVSDVRGDAACDNELEEDFTFSRNIDVELPEDQPLNIFAFDADQDPLQISCSEDGDRLVLTSANLGKAAATETEICLRLPAGIDIDFMNAEAIVPADFTLAEAMVTVEPINGSGDRQICFTPPEIGLGEFICIEIPFIVGDIPCGPVFIGATVVSFVQLECNGVACPEESRVSTVEDLYFEIDVVPAVTAEEAELTASCTGTPGVFDVDFSFDFVAESQPYNGEVVIELYTDIDANGEFDPAIDEQAGTSQSFQVNLAQDEAESFSGTFSGIDQSDICPLLLRIESIGCTCSESILPFPEVLPDFVDELGDAVTLCPGEDFTFDGICADLNYNFANPAAGTVTMDGSGNATISLNPGFGTDAPEELVVTGSFGSCSLEKIIDVSAPETLGFGPYEYTVCNVGRQEVDLNIPLAQQEDISVSITPTNNILNAMSFEPIIENLPADQVFDVEFAFNDGECDASTTLSVTVEEAIVVTVNDFTACQTGFDLNDMITVTPAFPGKFQVDGDGEFVPDNDFIDDDGNELPVRYIPGPMDIANGFVGLRYNSDAPEGPCGPTTERFTVTLLLVDCGEFFWDGSNDD